MTPGARCFILSAIQHLSNDVSQQDPHTNQYDAIRARFIDDHAFLPLSIGITTFQAQRCINSVSRRCSVEIALCRLPGIVLTTFEPSFRPYTVGAPNECPEICISAPSAPTSCGEDAVAAVVALGERDGIFVVVRQMEVAREPALYLGAVPHNFDELLGLVRVVVVQPAATVHHMIFLLSTQHAHSHLREMAPTSRIFLGSIQHGIATRQLWHVLRKVHLLC